MRRAFNALKNGRPGPVMVEVPADVMTSEFAGNDVDYTAIRPTRSAGDPRDIDDAAKMLLEAKIADHHRRPGRALRRSQRRAGRAGRTARHPGDDDDRRQERLPRGPRAGAGLGRRRLYRARPPVPARQRRDLRDRHEPDAAQHLDPDHPAGKEDHPRDQRSARPVQGQRHRDPDPRRRQAGAGAADRGGEGPARRQDARDRRPAAHRRSEAGVARSAGRRSCARPKSRSTRIS